MHPHPAFHWDDREAMRALVAELSFGALFTATPDGPRVAHVPAVWLDDDTLGLHVARGNGIAKWLDGATALFVVQGPEAYISPDWYGEGPQQVPTWNYLVVELEGTLTRMDDAGLAAQIDQLGAEQEGRLAKTPWTRGKMAPGAYEKMARGIHGYALAITAWRGTRKLGQTKSDAARLGAADALDAIGRKAMAHWMRHA